MISGPGRRENLPVDDQLVILAADLLRFVPNEFADSFDAVVHLAALPSVAGSWSQIATAHALNLTATLRVIELAQQLGISRIVYGSSAAVYGNPDSVPIGENHRLRPLSPYGLQKSASEAYGRLFARKNFSFVALRFFNVFGPRQVATSPVTPA